MPNSTFWKAFGEAFYVMEEERRELGRVASDTAALRSLQKIARFSPKPKIIDSYRILIDEWRASSASDRAGLRRDELVEIAKQEQLNILQPLIYDDQKLADTMKVNHLISRYSGGTLSPPYKVVYSSAPSTGRAELATTFDSAAGPLDWASGPKKSLTNPKDRMEYVAKIAEQYNKLMIDQRSYMEAELQKIRGWLTC